jgi:hypothetical protein
MRLLATAIPVLFLALTSLAPDNNNPEKWLSPHKKYAIKEASAIALWCNSRVPRAGSLSLGSLGLALRV